jgi:hypothetical protein
MENVSTKLINGFISELSDLDFRYLCAQSQIVASIKDLHSNYKIDKKDFCENIGIKPSEYIKFISGNYVYRLSHVIGIKHYGIKLLSLQQQSEDVFIFNHKK